MGIDDRAPMLIDYATRKYDEKQEDLPEDERIPAEMLFDAKYLPVDTSSNGRKNTKAIYQRIQRKIYSTLMSQIPNEALMKIENRGVLQGDGLGALPHTT